MTIKNKLRVSAATILFLFLAVCVLFVAQMNRNMDHSAGLVGVTIPKLGLMGEIGVEVGNLSTAEALHVIQVEPDRMAEKAEQLTSHLARVDGLLLRFDSLTASAAEKNALEALRVSFDAFIDNEKALLAASQANEAAMELMLLDRSSRTLRNVTGSLRALEVLVSKDAADAHHRQDRLLGETKVYVALLVGVTMAFLLLVAFLLRQTVLRPVQSLIHSIDRLAADDLAAEIPLSDKKDEIGDIARALFHFRRNALERRRLQKQEQDDLAFARQLQLSSVPSRYPAFPERPYLDLSGELAPCRSVGGDFFDYYFIDDRRLAITIADTSGKGVGSALFVSTARSALKLGSLRIADPARCLAEANDTLSAGNGATMFVTAFHAVLDVETGELLYGNAGHVPPLRVTGSGVVEELVVDPGLPLGVMAGIEFQPGRAVLAPGDALVLVTDGVTEAVDAHGTLFGADGLARAVARTPRSDCKSTVAAVLAAVREHLGAEVQSDDIAILALRYRAT
jgi:serine phosphatase RsbU (regulator of sigma subunit)